MGAEGKALDTQLISDIVERLTGVSRPDPIILFGSPASGRMTRDSDIDVLRAEINPAGAASHALTLKLQWGRAHVSAEMPKKSSGWVSAEICVSPRKVCPSGVSLQ
jgi:hypothetical protein